MPNQSPQQSETQPTVQPAAPRSRAGPVNRCRAAKACRRCNELRVKCDASERGTPCTRCEHKNEPECALIESRRGIYPRKTRGTGDKTSNKAKNGVSNTQSEPAPGNGIDSANGDNAGAEDLEGLTVQAVTSENGPHIRRDEARQRSNNNNGVIGTLLSTTAEQHTLAPEMSARKQSAGDNARSQIPNDGEINWYSQQTPALAGAPPDDISPSARTDVSTSSYRELSWATMFDHLLESHLRGEDVIEKGSITYLGESFPLAIVLEELDGRKGRPRLHHPGPPCPVNEELTLPRDTHPGHMLPEEIIFLEAKKAFESPDVKTLDALVDTFLTRVFCLYPILNCGEFIEDYKAKRVPWILLHALCFISATFCPLKILHQAGYENRRQARWTFYTKAKALFDVGYESNKIVVLQVSILMSFWGGGPNNYWNFYSWIGTGVTIAEALGCHRSLAGTNMAPRDRSLLKRLWWILVLRDANCSALVGRPFRVNLNHCDADPLTLEDFLHETTAAYHELNPHFGSYQIEAMKLTLILRQIITARFSPSIPQPQIKNSLTDTLLEWRAQLPQHFTWTDTAAAGPSILLGSLRVLYNHHMILANLNAPPEGNVRPGFAAVYMNQSLAEETCIIAAQQIASTACDVIVKSDILTAPHELLHGIFIAAVTFYMQTKSPSMMNAQSGRSGLSNCQMVLHESRGAWDPSPWILQLLDKMLGAPQSSKERAEDDFTMNNAADFVDDSSGMGINALDSNDMFATDLDIWQSHPVLGDLFDNMPNMLPLTPNFGNRSGNTPGPNSWSRMAGV
ncbi:hypothetical protein E4T39_07665 [Aureobasidium subglaciale]|nr:hypothetical protein E4T39_07665 [Aureobasidium subglaciale]